MKNDIMPEVLNRNVLKYIAVIAMLTDHTAMFFIPSGSLLYVFCRFIGRLTAPIMCYFLSTGYLYTSSKKNYAVRLFVFAVISQIPYALSHFNKPFSVSTNMIMTLFLSFCVLLAYDYISNTAVKWLVIATLLALTTVCDWIFIAPLWVLTFYIYRDNPKKQHIAFSTAGLLAVIVPAVFCIAGGKPWYSEIWQAGVFLFLPVISLYNGESGKKSAFNKWFFYIIYPLHLLIIWIIKYRI